MKGLIKKDLYMIKNNYKFLIVAFILYIFYSTMFDVDMSFFLPFMGLMVCMSTFSYDDYNNWFTYSSALPKGRINIVKSKYITTLSIVILLSIISIIMSYILSLYKNNLNFEDSLSTIMGEVLAIVLILSILYPILFKFGSEKGRIAMIITGLGIYGIVILLTKIVKIDVPTSLISFIDKHFVILFIIVSIILISISYLISKKIYLKREF